MTQLVSRAARIQTQVCLNSKSVLFHNFLLFHECLCLIPKAEVGHAEGPASLPEGGDAPLSPVTGRAEGRSLG